MVNEPSAKSRVESDHLESFLAASSRRGKAAAPARANRTSAYILIFQRLSPRFGSFVYGCQCLSILASASRAASSPGAGSGFFCPAIIQAGAVSRSSTASTGALRTAGRDIAELLREYDGA